MTAKHDHYDVNRLDDENGRDVSIFKVNDGWCGTRFLVLMAGIASFILYIIGSIITGIAYRTYEPLVNCTKPNGRAISTEYFVYETPMVVVGPCFMSAGGAILIFLLMQWCFCRPSIR